MATLTTTRSLKAERRDGNYLFDGVVSSSENTFIYLTSLYIYETATRARDLFNIYKTSKYDVKHVFRIINVVLGKKWFL